MTYELLILTLSFQKAAKKLSYVFEISTFIPYFHSKLFYLSFELQFYARYSKFVEGNN